MRNLVFENDFKFEGHMDRYVRSLFEPTIVFGVNDIETDKVLELFSSHDVLHYSPTIINASQHNLMLMAMYNMLEAGSLRIKTVHIIYGDHNDLIKELKGVWSKKPKYLAEVLKHVNVYANDGHWITYLNPLLSGITL